MAPDRFEETTTRGLGSRLGGSLVGVVAGLVFFIGAFFLLFYNEGSAVSRAKALEEGGAKVVSVAADAVDPKNEGKLVHATGLADTEQVLSDPDFGVKLRALRLARKVEVYQWREKERSETEKKLGGGTTTKTTYTYTKDWEEGLQSSGSFRYPEGHENPAAVPFSSAKTSADAINLGAFRVPQDMADRITGANAVNAETMPEALSRTMGGKARLVGGVFYLGRDPNQPEVGDMRVSFTAVAPHAVSVAARQSGSSFAPFSTSSGGTISLLQNGTFDAAAMFAAAKRDNTISTWLLRLLGFILMAVGLGKVLRPLSVLLDVVPFLGSLAGAGLGLVSFLLSLALSVFTIGVAWFFYRPVLSVGLLAVGGAMLAAAVLAGRKSGKQAKK